MEENQAARDFFPRGVEGGGESAGKCEIPDLASIATLPTEVGNGLEEQDTYSP